MNPLSPYSNVSDANWATAYEFACERGPEGLEPTEADIEHEYERLIERLQTQEEFYE